jgi:ABC-type bacteriocin/lantibiotic exporter with double-glycine peptidase domain
MTAKLDVPYHQQNRDYTCGPACLRMVLEYWDFQQDEVSLSMLCGTTIAGTGLAEIAEAARKLGFEAEWKRNAKFSELTNALKRGIPVMAIVDARLLHDIEMPLPVGHLIVIIAIDANTIFYHDPEAGREQNVSRSKFIQAWENLRKGMVIVWR